MDLNRIKAISAQEVINFDLFAKMVKSHISCLEVHHRELKGTKKVKYIFALKENKLKIHILEFYLSDQEVTAIRLVTSRPTINSTFYKNLLKIKGSKGSYGGIVVHIPTQNPLDLLDKINKTIVKSEETILLDPERTYSDPPQGWIEGVNGKPKKAQKITK